MYLCTGKEHVPSEAESQVDSMGPKRRQLALPLENLPEGNLLLRFHFSSISLNEANNVYINI